MQWRSVDGVRVLGSGVPIVFAQDGSTGAGAGGLRDRLLGGGRRMAGRQGEERRVKEKEAKEAPAGGTAAKLGGST